MTIVNQWMPIFYECEGGYENKEKAIEEAAPFFKNPPEAEKITFTANVRLAGIEDDGNGNYYRIITSKVISIEVVSRENPAEWGWHDEFKVITKSGSEYFVYSEEFNRYLCRLVMDYANGVDCCHRRYFPLYCEEEGFI